MVEFNLAEWLKSEEGRAATARIEITPKPNGRNQPPPIDDAPPVIGPADYSIISSPKVGIASDKGPASHLRVVAGLTAKRSARCWPSRSPIGR